LRISAIHSTGKERLIKLDEPHPKVIAAISDLDLDWLQEIINRHYPDGNLKLSNFDVNSTSSITVAYSLNKTFLRT
jgi:hypothetical protein